MAQEGSIKTGAGKNRRKHQRIICRVDVDAIAHKKWFVISSYNICLDGICLETEVPIKRLKDFGVKVKKTVDLRFFLPNSDNLIVTKGRVTYIKRVPKSEGKGGITLAGVNFCDMDINHRRELEDFVVDILNKNRSSDILNSSIVI